MKYESNISLDSKVIAKVKFTLDRQKDRWIDRQGDSYMVKEINSCPRRVLY